MSNNSLNMNKNLNLLDYIRCPLCNSVELENTNSFIGCLKCKNRYPKRDNILILTKPRNLNNIYKLWNKTERFNEFVFLTTPKISKLIRKYTNNKTVSLDVGCGVGAYQKDFSGSVISIDYIPYFIKMAAAKFGKSNRLFVIADANEFPFQDNVFDFELCSQVIEHFDVKASEKLMKNMIRTVKDTIIIDTPNDGNRFIHSLRSLVYPGKPNEIHGGETDIRMLHHKLMGRKDLEKYGFRTHSCIGFVSRNRFKVNQIWDLYDQLVWHFPDLGGEFNWGL